MSEFDDFDSLDDLEQLEPLDFDAASDSFDDTRPVPIMKAPAASSVPPPVAPQAPAIAAPAAPATGGLATVVGDLLQRRQYQQILQIADTQAAAVEQDRRLQAMVQQARQGLEQDAYVQSFLEASNQALEHGDAGQAQQFLDKARALDPEHPSLAATAAAIAAASTAPSAPVDDDPGPLSFDGGAFEGFDAGDADGGFDLDPIDDPPPLAAPAPAAAAQPPAQPSLDDSLASLDAFPEIGADLSLDDPNTIPVDPILASSAAATDVPGVVDLEAEADDDDFGGERADELLVEGNQLFEQGEYQSAIDVWSRIFLIDLDHPEASRRIEEARRKKAEIERRAEELFHQAEDQIEAGETDAAQESLRQVLEIQPSHVTAREYLNQLEAGEVPVIHRSSDTGESAPIDLDDDGGLGALDAVPGEGEGQTLEAAVARDRVVVVKKTDRRLIGLAAVVALLVLGVATFLFLRWDDLFPNTDAAPPVARVDTLDRANQIYEQGKVENAIVLLEKIPVGDPDYDKAVALLDQWRAEVDAPEVVEDTGPSDEVLERRRLLLDAARQAMAERQYLRAGKYFDRANKIQVLDAADIAERRRATKELEPLAEQIQQFQLGEYDRLIPQLWRLRDASPDDPNVEQLLVDSYYNVALADLLSRDPAAASEKLADATEVQPEDEELLRMKLFADSYVKRSPDLLYLIFIKYLPSRT